MRQVLVWSAIATLCSLSAAHAEVTDCTEIAALPAVISTPGIHCLKGNLNFGPASGVAINVQANNVTLDLNGFTLSNSSAGPATTAFAVYSTNRRNTTIRNGTIRGFARAVQLEGIGAFGHVIEDLRVDTSRHMAVVAADGNGYLIRNNYILNTTGSTEAIGIVVGPAENVKILNNVISRTQATSAYGIFVRVTGAQLVEIADNSIFDTIGAPGYGIATSGQNVSLIGNRILNGAAMGATGIFSFTGGPLNCINNFVARFTNTGFGTCDFASGNLPP